MSDQVRNIDIIISLVQKGSNVVSNVAKQLRSLKGESTDASKSVSNLSSSLEKVDSVASSAARGLDKTAKSSKKVVTDVTSASKALKGMTDSLGSFVNTIQRSILVQFAKESAEAIVDVSLKWTRFNNTLSYVFESSEETADALQFLRDTSEELGVSLESSVEGFSQMAAAAKGSSLEGQGVRDIYKALVTTGSALGLSQQKLSNTFYAITQMMSKGTVQTEELKRQLGDQLPGAMVKAAQSMGLTKDAFVKLVESGKLLADDFLPRFAAFLTNEMTPAAERNAKAMVGSFTKMQTAWFEFKVAITEGDMSEVLKNIFDSITESLQDKELIESVTRIVKYVGDMVLEFLDLVKTGPSVALWSVGLTSAFTLVGSLAVQFVRVVRSLKTILGAVVVGRTGLAGLAGAISLVSYAFSNAVQNYLAWSDEMNRGNVVLSDQIPLIDKQTDQLSKLSKELGIGIASIQEYVNLQKVGAIVRDESTGKLKLNYEAYIKYHAGLLTVADAEEVVTEAVSKTGQEMVDNLQAQNDYKATIDELTIGLPKASDNLNTYAIKVADLKLALASGKISQEEFNTQILKLNQEHWDAEVKILTDALAEKKIALDKGKIKYKEYETAVLNLRAAEIELAKAGNAINTSIDETGKALDKNKKRLEDALDGWQKVVDEGIANYTLALTDLDIALAKGQITEAQYYERSLEAEKEHWVKMVATRSVAVATMAAAGLKGTSEYNDALQELRASELELIEIENQIQEETSKTSDVMNVSESAWASFAKKVGLTVEELKQIVTPAAEAAEAGRKVAEVSESAWQAFAELVGLTVEELKDAIASTITEVEEAGNVLDEFKEKWEGTFTYLGSDTYFEERYGKVEDMTKEFLDNLIEEFKSYQTVSNRWWTEYNTNLVQFKREMAEQSLKLRKEEEAEERQLLADALEEEHQLRQDAFDEQISMASSNQEMLNSQLEIDLAKGIITQEQYDQQVLQAEKETWTEILKIRTDALTEMVDAGKEGTEEYLEGLQDINEAELKIAQAENQVVTDKLQTYRDILEDKLSMYEEQRDGHQSMIDDLIAEEDRLLRKLEDVNDAQEQMNQSILDQQRDIAREGMTVAETYVDDQEAVSEALSKARQAYNEGDFEAAQAYLENTLAANAEFSSSYVRTLEDGGEQIIANEQTVRDTRLGFLQDIQNLSDDVNAAAEKEIQTDISVNDQSLKDVYTTLQDIDDQIADIMSGLDTDMELDVNIDAEDALAVIEELQEDTSSTHTIHIEEVTDSSGGGDTDADVPGFATGGRVPGSGNKDTVPAMLTPGEFVIKKSMVKSLGAGFFAAINHGRMLIPKFNFGGLVSQIPQPRINLPAFNTPTQYFAAGGQVQNPEPGETITVNLNLGGVDHAGIFQRDTGLDLLNALQTASNTMN